MAPPVESCFDQVIELRDKCRESSDRKDFKDAVKSLQDGRFPACRLLYPQQHQTAIDTRFTL